MSVHALLGRTGVAITVSALATGVGFGALLLADYGAMRSFGSLMLLGLGCTWIASIVVLPSALLVLGRLSKQ